MAGPTRLPEFIRDDFLRRNKRELRDEFRTFFVADWPDSDLFESIKELVIQCQT